MNILSFFLSLFKNPKAWFIWGLLSKWYLMIAIPAVLIVFYILSSLDKIGVIDRFESLVATQIGEFIRIAQECTPKILHIKQFIDCL